MTATHEALNMEEAIVASGAQSHSRHPSTSTICGPLPTDSMGTVRLSDPPVVPALEESLPPNSHVIPLESQVLEGQQGAKFMRTDNRSEDSENALFFEDDIDDTEKQLVKSMAGTVGEDQSIRTFSTIRSRSDTSGSFSSNGSAQVDWDELEKSEEQAPRDEGSDEVRPLALDNRVCSDVI